MADPAYLVVVLPGIGGTRLAVPGERDQPIWTAGLGTVGAAIIRPDRLSVSEHPKLDPVGLITSQKAFGVWTVIQGYDTLLKALADQEDGLPAAIVDDGTGPARLDANIVAAGYDFRLGVAAAAAELDANLQPRLKHLWPKPADRTDKVFFVAHSMGGLVARYWTALPENRALCKLILTLGTPHRGAPKAVDVLANGVAVKGIHLVKWPLPMLRQWQGLYDLLPRYQGVADQSPAATPGALAYPKDLPLPGLDSAMANRAFAMHEVIEKAWAELGWTTKPHVEPRIGWGQPTLRQTVWDGRRVTVTKDPHAGIAMGAYESRLGDGTVPAFSAMPIEKRREQPVNYLEELRHGPLAALQTVTSWVKDGLGFGDISDIRGDEEPVVLGVDLDPVLAPRTPTGISAMIHGAEPHGARVAALVREGSDSLQPPTPVRLAWSTATNSFEGELPGLEPGLHNIEVRAERIPGGGRRTIRDTIEVVDDADH